MPVPVAAFYTALIILLAVVLVIRVTNARGSAKVSLGDGGDETLQRRVRAHGNFSETVPLVLIGLALAELNGASVWWLHVLGIALVLSRIGHAIGMDYKYPNIPFRVVSMYVTGGIFILLAATLLKQALLG